MSTTLDTTYRSLLEAVAFAARAHQGQLRKDRRTPYHSHVFRVCLIVRDLFNVIDRQALLAAVLHDTLEDTTTDFDDLEEAFGAQVARWVAALSKDSRLPEEEREAAYVEVLKKAPWQVRICKLADMYDNMMDMQTLPPKKQGTTLQRLQRYLDALKVNQPSEITQAWDLVARLHAERVTAAAKASD